MELSTILVTLEKLEKIHHSLYELASNKTNIVKSNQVEELDLILKAEQAHVAAIETIEQQRQVQVKQYLTNKEFSYTGMPTLAHLIEAAHEDPMLAELKAQRERLIEAVEMLKVQNDLNQKLVFQSLQFINMSLNTMQPQQQEQVNYSDKEVLGQNTVSKKSYFDSQA